MSDRFELPLSLITMGIVAFVVATVAQEFWQGAKARREQSGTAANVDCPACSTTHRATLVPYTGKHAGDRNAWTSVRLPKTP